MKFDRIRPVPIAGALGAKIAGVDLAKDLSDDVIAEIRAALLEFLVLFFRDQDITPEQHMAFGKRFGDVVAYPMVSGLDDFPDIVPVIKREHETVNFGGLWHSDTTYLAEPPMGGILVARELPPKGGDTLWANMYLAYETLSDSMKRMLAGLRAVNSSAKADVTRTREDRVREDGTEPEELVAEHPVIRTHPETGKKILYVNYGHTVRFSEMSEDESAPILDYLFRH